MLGAVAAMMTVSLLPSVIDGSIDDVTLTTAGKSRRIECVDACRFYNPCDFSCGFAAKVQRHAPS